MRGTAFELYVTAAWVYVLMQNGATINCPKGGGDCMILDDKCEYGIMGISSTEIVGHTDGVSGADRDQIKEFFLYALNQSPLAQQFRLAGAERCLRQPSGGRRVLRHRARFGDSAPQQERGQDGDDGEWGIKGNSISFGD